MQIIVTNHAVERFRKRKPTRRSERALREQIESEVEAAFAAGRRSRAKPDWLGLFNQPRKRLPEGEWFCWPESESHAYLIRRDRFGGTGYIVVTTLTRTGGSRPGIAAAA